MSCFKWPIDTIVQIKNWIRTPVRTNTYRNIMYMFNQQHTVYTKYLLQTCCQTNEYFCGMFHPSCPFPHYHLISLNQMNPTSWLVNRNISPFIEPIGQGVRKLSALKVFDALLLKLYPDWLKYRTFCDINQSDIVLVALTG